MELNTIVYYQNDGRGLVISTLLVSYTCPCVIHLNSDKMLNYFRFIPIKCINSLCLLR